MAHADSTGWLCVLLLWVMSVAVPAVDAQPVKSSLHVTGPDARRVNIVILAEGYTQAEQAKFDVDAKRVRDAILATDPYVGYASFFNIYSIFVASAESGTDVAAVGSVDTYFESYLNCGGASGQVMCLTEEGDERLADLLDDVMPGFDLPIVLVNIQGSAGATGPLAAIASAEPTGQLAVHELGHLFADLADEYESAEANTHPTLTSPNVTTTTHRSLIPWIRHIRDDTPVPTPATAEFADRVGLFAASSDTDLGWFRAQQFCKMRSLVHDFCIVCKEAHVRAIYREISPIETFTPLATELGVPTGELLDFRIDLLEPTNHALEIEWFVDGIAVPGARSDTFQLGVGRFHPETFVVAVRVTDPSPLAAQAFRHTQRWSVTRSDFADVPQATMFGDSQLGQNFPNPVAGATTIDFVLERESFVTLRVHDLAGRVVATLVSGGLPAGLHEATWDTRDAARGIYLYTLNTSDGTETRKLVVM